MPDCTVRRPRIRPSSGWWWIRSGSIRAQGSSRTYLDRPEYLLDWCAYFTQKGDALRAEGLLNDAIQNLARKAVL